MNLKIKPRAQGGIEPLGKPLLDKLKSSLPSRGDQPSHNETYLYSAGVLSKLIGVGQVNTLKTGPMNKAQLMQVK